MDIKDQMFCGYIVFLKETTKNRQEFEEKVVKAADDYLLGKGIS